MLPFCKMFPKSTQFRDKNLLTREFQNFDMYRYTSVDMCIDYQVFDIKATAKGQNIIYFYYKEALTKMFSREYYEIFKDNYIEKQFISYVSQFINPLTTFCVLCKLPKEMVKKVFVCLQLVKIGFQPRIIYRQEYLRACAGS